MALRILAGALGDDLRHEDEAVDTAVRRFRDDKFANVDLFRLSPDVGLEQQLRAGPHPDLILIVLREAQLTDIAVSLADISHLPRAFLYLPDEPSSTNGRVPQIDAPQTIVRRFTSIAELGAMVRSDLERWCFDEHLEVALNKAALAGDHDELRRLIESVRDEQALRSGLARAGVDVGRDIAQSLIVTGNNNVISYLVEGINTLPNDFSSLIGEFLNLYLGDSTRRVPFGGRETELAALDAWIDNPGSPPYHVVAGPAGRGKSALLVQWARRLLARQDVAVVFFPVSVRLETHKSSVVYPAIAARLSALHGLPVQFSLDSGASHWRGIVADLLRQPLPDGRQLILIIDGVDEAADDWHAGPNFLPSSKVPGLRILISARYLAEVSDAHQWLEKLGWGDPAVARAWDLQPLSRDGIADALRSMGNPLERLGSKVTILNELFRLSEGDPLLVRLYVEDLRKLGEESGRVRPEDLRKLEPGYKPYFVRWWNDQRALWSSREPLKERTVQTILNILACAIGPLTQSDLRNLCPPEIGLNPWTLEEALRPLHRFIIGDGREHGFVFSHPRLASYFYDERLDDAERREWEERFVAWGSATVGELERGQVSPEKVSPYLIQFYGTHLQRAGKGPEAWVGLITDGWRRAWESIDGTYAGFVSDVTKASAVIAAFDRHQLARTGAAPYLDAEVRCALWEASVNSLAGTILPNLLAALVDSGVWTSRQASAYARQVPGVTERILALLVVIPRLSGTPAEDAHEEVFRCLELDPDRGLWTGIFRELTPLLPAVFLPKAVDLARRMTDADARDASLAGLATRMIELGMRRQALMLASGVASSTKRALVLLHAMPTMSVDELKSSVAVVLELALGLDAHEFHTRTILGLLAYLPEPLRRAARLGAITKACQDDRAEVLVGYLPLLDERERPAIASEALDSIRGVDAPGRRAQLLVDLLPYIPAPERAAVQREAVALVDSATDTHERAQVLAAVAPYLPDAERAAGVHEIVAHARARASAIEQVGLLQRALPFVPASERHVLVAEALENVRGVEAPGMRAQLLVDLLPHVAPLNRGEVENEAVALTVSTTDEHERAQVLAAVAPYIPEARRASAIREALASLQLPRTHHPARPRRALARSLADLAIGLGELHFLQPALAVAWLVADDGIRARTLLQLAPAASKPERAVVLRDVEVSIQAIDDEAEHTELIMLFARCLAELGEHDQALTMARRIPHVPERAVALAQVIPRLPESTRGQALQFAAVAISELRCSPEAEAEALRTLLPEFSPTDRPAVVANAVRRASTLREAEEQARALITLAASVSGEERQPMLAAAAAIARRESSAFPPATQARLLADAIRTDGRSGSSRLVDDALQAARLCEDDHEWAEVLALIHPYVPADQFLDEVERRGIAHGQWQSIVFTSFVAMLPVPVLRNALAGARAIRDQVERADTVVFLARYLVGCGRPEPALAALCRIADALTRAVSLAPILPGLPPPLRDQAVDQLLGDLALLDDDAIRGQLVDQVVPLLRPELAPVIVEVIQHFADPVTRAQRLIPWLPYLQPLPGHVLDLIRTITLELQDTTLRAELLVGIATNVLGRERARLISGARAAIGELRDPVTVLRLTARLLPAMEEAERLDAAAHAIDIARTLPEVVERMERAAEIAATLPDVDRDDLARRLLTWLPEIDDHRLRALALARASVHLPLTERRSAARLVVDELRRIRSQIDRSRAVLELFPRLALLLDVDQLLVLLERTAWSRDKILALLSVLPRVDADARERLLIKTLGYCESISPADQGTALAEFVRLLVEHHRSTPLLAVAIERIPTVKLRLATATGALASLDHEVAGRVIDVVVSTEVGQADAVQKAMALLVALELTSPDDRPRLVQEVRGLILQVSNAVYKVTLLARLAANVRGFERTALVDELMEIIRGLDDPEDVAVALLEFRIVVPHVSNAAVLREILEKAVHLRALPERSLVCAALAKRFDDLALDDEALVAILATASNDDRAQLVLDLLPRATGAHRQRLRAEAENAIDLVAATNPTRGYAFRVQISAYSDATALQRAEHLVELAESTPLGSWDDVSVLASDLVRNLQSLPKNVLYEAWHQRIQETSKLTRPEALARLARHAPIMVVLAGAEGLAAVLETILDVGDSWG